MSKRSYKELTFKHTTPIVSWCAAELERHNDQECINCGGVHRKDSAFCSYFCQVEYKRAA